MKTRALLLAAAVTVFATGASAQALYLHNGSLMTAGFDGNQFIIKYLQPRSGLSDIGVRSGTILFHGTGRYVVEGMAYRFKAGCAALPYRVAGDIDRVSFVLTGMSAQYSRYGCALGGYRWDEQSVLTFIRVGG